MDNNNQENVKRYYRKTNFQNKVTNQNLEGNEKTATDNQWVSTGLKPDDNREHRDGPGGEDYLGK